VDQVRRDHPQDWEALLEANNRPGPMTLRVNARRGARDAVLAGYEAAGIRAQAVGAAGLQLEQARPVDQLPGFTEGAVSVQDAAAQLAAPLLLQDLQAGPSGRLRLLDACAAPGGKTAHLLEMADADVTALEIDSQRGERIRQTLDRLGLAARIVTADAGDVQAWWDGQPYDGILLDAPCTASGIVRRHPDVRWLRRPADLPQLAAQQQRLLQALWPLVRPGGQLLYCTCSVFRAEGEAQARTFVANNTAARLRPGPGHLLPRTGAEAGSLRDNPLGDHDGFYYALLHKARGGD
jgi:16S rRNA (cytosine967-C5)-methyltransferase